MFFPQPPKLLFIQPTTFPPQKQIKTESMNFPHIQWDCQNFAHILNYLISQPLVSEYPPQQKCQSPTPGGEFTKYPSALLDTKKMSLSCSAPITRLFETILVDRGQKRAWDITCAPNSWYQQTSTKTGMPSISTQNPQLHKH